MLSIRRFIRWGSAGALLVTGVGLGAIVSSPPAGASGFSWSVVPTPNPSSSPNDNLLGVTCTSTSDCWSVGSASSGPGLSQTLAEHWDGTAWSIVTTPNASTSQENFLYGVACTGTSDCWAVGTSVVSGFGADTLAEHWNGSAWSIITTPNPSPGHGNQLLGVACVSASDCWAVGVNDFPGANVTLAEHWNGSAWSIVTTPNPSPSLDNLSAVACTGTSDCWAVGFASAGLLVNTLAEHWNGSTWSIVTTPNPSPNFTTLDGVACVSSSDCWAVGESGSYTSTLAEQWNGISWSIVTTPNASSLGVAAQNNLLTGVTCAGPSDCWAVGDASTGSGGSMQTLAEQWNGSDWSIVTTPNPSASQNDLNAVACTSAANCWAVGFASGSVANQTLAEHGSISATPTSTVLTSTPAVEGQTTTLTATVAPVSGGGTPTGSVEFIDWTAGSILGSVALRGGAASLKPVFPEEGSHLVSAVYSGDSNFLSSNATQTITVTDASLSGQSASALLQGREGVPFFAQAVPVSGVVASFTDVDPGGTVSDYAATIDWGDGISSPGTVGASGSGFTVSGSHTYQEDGNYPIVVHIADVGGSTTSVVSSAHVSEPTNFIAFLVDLFFERFGF